MHAAGKVFLVGAGPGHPELITVKGLRLLEQADAVVYDRLVQEELLAACRPDAERVYVGKAPGRHESRQAEIDAMLVALGRRHGLVVRLKGGDPLLFGRGGEEAEALARAGIPFEIIPGVTSALAAPAAAGIPVTHRGHACTVAVVTGHEKDGAGDGRIDWAALARIDTVVVLMGVHRLPQISQALIANGRAPTTPAAIIETAFWAGERVLEGTLATIAEVAAGAGVRPPATVVVGEVVGVRALLKNQARELARTASADQETPGPSPQALDRMVSGLREACLLVTALELGIFDDLEVPRAPADLARRRGLAPVAMADLCASLVTSRLLVARDGTVRNTEVASRFLCTSSPSYLGAMLRGRLELVLTTDWLGGLRRRPAPERLERSAGMVPACPPTSDDADWSQHVDR
ncbi:MAG: uroporphyrinogen-III C-methyltransferase [Deltaproteobacteria bacterium]|nr:uroporphyrinogen-III C-methyltransferase [Deltaproteobacteria bacterium]